MGSTDDKRNEGRWHFVFSHKKGKRLKENTWVCKFKWKSNTINEPKKSWYETVLGLTFLQ